MIFVNQKRMKIGVLFGDPEIETGGRSPGFFSSQIVRVRRGEKILAGKQQVGFELCWRLHKEKTGGDEQGIGTARFYHTPSEDGIDGGVFDNEGDIIPFAVDLGVIERNGATYSFAEEKLGVGKGATGKFLRENPSIYDEIESRCIRKAVNERNKLLEDKQSRANKQRSDEKKPVAGKRGRPKIRRKTPNGKR